MDRLNQSDVVRIVQIDGPVDADAARDGRNKEAELAPWRIPVIGDVGTIVHLASPDGKRLGNPDDPGTRYIVHGTAPDGRTEWVAEFARGELELVKRAGK